MVQTIEPRRWLVLGVMCIGLVVTGLDSLIVSVALPTIEHALGASHEDLQWIVAAYSVAFATFLLFGGTVADKVGRKATLLGGLGVFLLASLLAALSSTVAILILSRALMGVGAAFTMPATLAIVKQIFPADERGKAIGIWVGMSSLGIPLGPLVGGVLLRWFPWGSVFLINVPLLLIALVACVVLVPESRRGNVGRLDVPGLVLSVVGLSALVYAITMWPSASASGQLWLALGSLVVAVLALGGFVFWERRTSSPLISLQVVRQRSFSVPLVTIAGLFFAVFGALFIITQVLQNAQGLSPLMAGLHMLALCTAVPASSVSPRLAAQAGLKVTAAVSGASVALACAVLTISPFSPSITALVSLGLLGVGIGFGAPPSVDSIMGSVPDTQAGAGAAMADVAMQLGGALGITVMGTLGALSFPSTNAPGIAGLLVGLACIAITWPALRDLRPQQETSPEVSEMKGTS